MLTDNTRHLGLSVLGVSTLIQLYQRPWLIQDDTRLIQNCINRLKTFLCNTNLYHRVKNDLTMIHLFSKILCCYTNACTLVYARPPTKVFLTPIKKRPLLKKDP